MAETWVVKRGDEIIMGPQDNGTFNFPPNTEEGPITYTVYYTGETGCEASIDYTLNKCECSINLSVSDLECESVNNYVTVTKQTDIPQTKRNSQCNWSLKKSDNTPVKSGNFYLRDLDSPIKLTFGSLEAGVYKFDWEIIGCGSGSKDNLECDGMCRSFSAGKISLHIYNFFSTNGGNYIPYGIQYFDMQYKLLVKTDDGYTPLTGFESGGQYFKVNNVNAEMTAGYTSPTKLPAIDVNYDTTCDYKNHPEMSSHMVQTVYLNTDLDVYVSKIRSGEIVLPQGKTIDDVYIELCVTHNSGTSILIRCDCPNRPQDQSMGCAGNANIGAYIYEGQKFVGENTGPYGDNVLKNFNYYDDPNYGTCYISKFNIREMSSKTTEINIWSDGWSSNQGSTTNTKRLS